MFTLAESDPEDDPGDLGEGHELPDIEDDHDISDEEYDVHPTFSRGEQVTTLYILHLKSKQPWSLS